jgi:peptide/nickel transport system ATP-binding protein
VSLLEISGLRVSIGGEPVLNGVDLSVDAGETVGLVGESGSGKSMTALAAMGLLPHGSVASGTVALDGTDILAADEATLCTIRGRRVGMVFQEPMTALNPVKTIGSQVAEGIAWHTGASRAEAEAQAARMLDRVGLSPARFPLDRYPHQLSGGQRQRVVIAIACALEPRLLIADEPTTALDVVLQRQILDLLRELVHETRMGLLLISHDLAVVTEMADRIAIMRAGTIVDGGETGKTLSAQRHPYTRQLALASTHMPDRRPPRARPASESAGPLLDVRGVSRIFRTGSGGWLRKPMETRAVDDVSFALRHGRSTALVGRSGCGKSTLARLILALDQPTSGTISFEGTPVTGRSQSSLSAVRRNLQVVFQDPFGSLDPRLTIEKSVAEPLGLLPERLTRSQRRDRVAAALHEVGLSPDMMDRHPHQFSGGQRQRISIARAIITRPKLVVADEAVSALDVSIRAQILDLFTDLNQKLGLTYLFITHDLNVARAITDDVLVMHEGRIVERGETEAVLDNPQSEAAKALVAAAPDLRRALATRLREQG